jgi:integrase
MSCAHYYKIIRLTEDRTKIMTRLTKPKPSEPIRLTSTRAGEPRYQVVLTSTPPGTKTRRQVRRNFHTLAQARAYVDRTRSEVREGRFTATDTTTLEQLAGQWLDTRRDIRDVSRTGYETVLKPILNANGDRRVQSISRPDVEGWVESWRVTGGVRGRGISHRSIVYSLGALHQVLDHAVAQGLLTRNPADGVKAPRKRAEDRHEVTIWSAAELTRFLKVADQDEWAAAWRMTAAGLRRSEVLGLDWSAVDWEKGEVEVRQGRVKTGRAMITTTDDPKSAASRRTVPVEAMWPGTIALLRTLRSAQAEQRLAAGGQWVSDLVVVDAAGQGIDPDVYSSRFRELSRSAGLPAARLHSIRHTGSSILHDEGVPPAAVARLYGHTVQTHLAYYVKSSDDPSLWALLGAFYA